MDLITFLAARLDEDEALAKAAQEDSGEEYHWNEDAEVWRHEMSAKWAAHALRHNPVRVLREVKADRLLIQAYEDRLSWVADVEDGEYDDREVHPEWQKGAAAGLFAAIELRAAIYSDHPDCDPAWKL